MTEAEGFLDWAKEGALCAAPENREVAKGFVDPPSEESRNAAKNLCFSCDVRLKCVKFALENKQHSGVWGGKDENEIRRTLSIDSDGEEIRRGRAPQCPSCSARTSKLKVKVIDLPGGGRWTQAKVVECTVCHFEWKSRTSANAVDAYFAERAAKAAKAERKRRTTTKKAATEVTA